VTEPYITPEMCSGSRAPGQIYSGGVKCALVFTKGWVLFQCLGSNKGPNTVRFCIYLNSKCSAAPCGTFAAAKTL